MRKFIKPIQIAILVLLSIYCKAQVVPVKWDLTLKFDSNTNIYTVYGTPDTTYTFNGGWTMASAQITVLIPDSLPDNPLNITSFLFGGWSESDNCFNGINGGGYDYHSITTFGQVKPIFKDSLMKFFSFPSPDSCKNFVRLLRNTSETYVFVVGGSSTVGPDNINPCPLQGSDYGIYLSNGTVQLEEAYNANENNYGWHCGPYPLSPLSTLLKNVEAKVVNCNAIFTWESLNEKDVEGYTIMVSKDGNTFSEIGKVDAIGTANKYTFEQVNANSGTNYYKIIIRKKNNILDYSNLLKLTIYCNGAHIASAYPNPTTDAIDFAIKTGTQDENTEVEIQILDMLGNVVMENKAIIMNSNLKINIKTSALANGNYMIRYHNDMRAYSGVVKFAKVGK
jgi:Secretion system C-terminal sorting domain